MTTSPKTTSLSKPVPGQPISQATLAYFAARNRYRVHELVLREFQKADISQAELARRLNRGTDVVCRLLGAPGNWGLDTVSNLLFAISGAEPNYGINRPLDQPTRNQTRPEYLDEFETEKKPVPLMAAE